MTRLPAGHPEGYLEAFANLYLQFAEKIRAFHSSHQPDAGACVLPGINDGMRGMAFIEAAVSASNSDCKWYPMPDVGGLSDE